MSPTWTSGFAISDDDTRLFYEVCADGPPLLLCDGLFCEGHVWKYFIPEFSARNQLIHWHYPGHGKSDSPKSTADLSIYRFSRDVCAVLEAAQVAQAVLVGHSLGVQVALETAYRFPDKVAALVLICGSPGQTVKTFHDSPVMESLLPLLGMGTRFVPRHLMSLWRLMPVKLISTMVKQSDEINRRLIDMEDLKPYFEGMFKTDINIATRILEKANHHDMLPVLGEIHHPTLVIAGKRDRFTPSYRSRQMADQLPNAEILVSEVGTHSLPLEQPDLVNLAVAKFLDALDSAQN